MIISAIDFVQQIVSNCYDYIFARRSTYIKALLKSVRGNLFAHYVSNYNIYSLYKHSRKESDIFLMLFLDIVCSC